jgi:hypothetical protein
MFTRADIKTFLKDDNPMAVYDIQTKKVVGLFSDKYLLIRYLFCCTTYQQVASKRAVIKYSIHHRGRIHKNALGFTTTIRYCNEAQKLELGDAPYLIMKGYREADPDHMKRFFSTRLSLWKEGTKKIRAYYAKLRERKAEERNIGEF